VPTEGRSTSLAWTLGRVCCSGVADGLGDSEFWAARWQVFHKPRLQLFILARVHSANLLVLRCVAGLKRLSRGHREAEFSREEIFGLGELVNWRPSSRGRMAVLEPSDSL
jgi:hypothetical protein